MRHVLSLSSIAITLAACASAPPDDEPAAPTYEDDAKADSAFEDNLVGARNEWGEIIRPDEAEVFADLAQKINELQSTLAGNAAPQRGFHAKVHGCMTAELQPDPDRPAETRHGVFAGNEVKQAWVRLSNGQGRSFKDNERDVRGLAIKLMGVDGNRLVDDGATTQDILMTNRPGSHVNDAVQFMEFAEAAAHGELIRWALHHPVAAGRLFRQTAPVKTLVTKYWTGSPYRLGPNVAKLSVWPCTGQSAATLGATPDDADFLGVDLEHRVQYSTVCYELGVQIRRNPAIESVEKGSAIWSEERNPFVKVGRVVIAQRTLAEIRADRDYCNDLAFNPWNGLVEHRPLGHMNRARRPVYRSSASFRGHVVEPRPQ